MAESEWRQSKAAANWLAGARAEAMMGKPSSEVPQEVVNKIADAMGKSTPSYKGPMRMDKNCGGPLKISANMVKSKFGPNRPKLIINVG